ncbi:MAG: bifunctional phosphoribosylaminoimidazolecarboxamide formyltransferase/IMP cyclohydrolase [Rhizobiales bacterium]|nr:bifunctional phosphoribosylaminoimidazolecarboxamide formyltransferase/IMP cyclohydrolase [Hyphomicrobiales bacterium]
MRKIERALISVSDKTGLVELAGALVARGVALVSTGGTARSLREAGFAVADVSDVTGFPEMMDGRLKTLHPRVHGGLLAVRDDADHMAAAGQHGIPLIDLLVVNLYPFEATVSRGAGFAETIENIDIGGPAMIRAAAKNHAGVAVVVDPSQYPDLLGELDRNAGATSSAFRLALARAAFERTAAYDAAIAGWLQAGSGDLMPRHLSIAGEQVGAKLRYGENPHQSAVLYRAGPPRPGVVTARQLAGKALSYNNLNDADAAFELVAEFDPDAAAAVAIIKHANPCGVAVAETLEEAYRLALRCDPVSAFGGIVAVNRHLDVATARAIAKVFTEVVIAPSADDAACDALGREKNPAGGTRVLVTGGLPDPRAPGRLLRPVAGGLLVQGRDNAVVADLTLEVVTRRAPSAAELADLRFAFRVAKHVKSNAIVYARAGATVGIGAGQMSRVDSARIARWKGTEAAKAAGLEGSLTDGSVVASDAFFPFADGLLEAAAAGATAVIQPGGSVRDAEVIRAADEHGLAMVFTGVRHFRH